MKMIDLVKVSVAISNFGIKKVNFQSSDNLVIVTGKSGIGKSLIFQIIELIYQSMDSNVDLVEYLPENVYLHEPTRFAVASAIDDLNRNDNGLVVLDDLDLILDSVKFINNPQLKKKFLTSILNSPNEVIVVCKKVPNVFKLPDRFFYNLKIKDGIATIEQTLREGLCGIVKNNYTL